MTTQFYLEIHPRGSTDIRPIICEYMLEVTWPDSGLGGTLGRQAVGWG